MDRLYTPWRMKYVTAADKHKQGCVFCANWQTEPARDRLNYIIYRGQAAFTVMNIYPYNTGHLMILPCAHVGALVEVDPAAQFEMITLTTYFTGLLSELLHPDGFNVGLNMGRAAGAGIDSHLHIHIVPRWQGDSNFMPIIGETRVLPELLEDTYDKIVALLKQQPPQIPSW